MSAYPTDLSLAAAIRKFQEVTSEERKLHIEHKKLLRAHIDESIAAGCEEAIYEVPPALSGAFAEYDVNEMTLWLVKQCRAGNLRAQVIHYSPPTIRVWGWYDASWLDRDRPPHVPRGGGGNDSNGNISISSSSSRRPTTIPPRRRLTTPSSKKAVAKKKGLTPEEASVMAQMGTLSSHLKATLERSRRKQR